MLDPRRPARSPNSRARAQAGLADRHARPATRPRRQYVARHDVPGARSPSSTSRTRSSPPGRCRRKPTSTPRSTWCARSSSHVDGKVWTQNNGFAAIHRLDLETGNDRIVGAVQDGAEGRDPQHLRRDPGFEEQRLFHRFRARSISAASTRRPVQITLFADADEASAPRRGMMDAQDRLWFGEYRGNRIGMFDTKTEKFQEWADADAVDRRPMTSRSTRTARPGPAR